MARGLSGSRCSCGFVVWSLVVCILILHLYSTIHRKYVQIENIQLGTTLLSELEKAEELQIPTPIRGKSLRELSLLDEFLNKSSEFKSFFFPDKKTCMDPSKGIANGDNLYYFPGQEWLDTDGNPIQARGGGILYDDRSSTYFWYGEYKDGPTYRTQGKGTPRVDVIGVGCYSSKDLWTWKKEGIVLSTEGKNESHDLHKSNVLERPKVIYNEKTGMYVMWMHIDNAAYTKASVGIAISDSPTGPFTYLYSKRPHGYESRDMTLFKDDDGMAYVVYSSVHNKELHVGQLRQDYLDVTDVMSKVLVGQYREAPALFKHQGTYYMITSGCSGWAPNEALAHRADSVLGPWETIGNPSVGANKVFRITTFFAQSTFVLPMPGGDTGSFIFMADRWNPNDLRNSRYVWLPLTVRDAAKEPAAGSLHCSKVSIFWHTRWRLLCMK